MLSISLDYFGFVLRMEMGKKVRATHSKSVFNRKSDIFGQIGCGLLQKKWKKFLEKNGKILLTIWSILL